MYSDWPELHGLLAAGVHDAELLLPQLEHGAGLDDDADVRQARHLARTHRLAQVHHPAHHHHNCCHNNRFVSIVLVVYEERGRLIWCFLAKLCCPVSIVINNFFSIPWS